MILFFFFFFLTAVFRLPVARRSGDGVAVDALREDRVCRRVSLPEPRNRDAAGSSRSAAQRPTGETTQSRPHTDELCTVQTVRACAKNRKFIQFSSLHFSRTLVVFRIALFNY